MGALVSLFQSDGGKGNDIFLDFEDARPQGEEEDIYGNVSNVLREGVDALVKINEYKGCEKQIREAISKPSVETEKEAWVSLLPAISILKEIFDYSTKLQEVFPLLLNALMKDDDHQSLVTKQALAKQLADVFDFVLQFDDAKMMNPAIQNDFSYYRRVLARIKLSNHLSMDDVVVRDDLANRMSLFFAHATPMMRVLTETTVNYLESDGPENNVTKNSVTNGLSLMANVCLDMVHKRRYTSEETNMFCLRSMTGCIILVDHIHPQGAFYKKSPIKIKSCITTLKAYEGNTQGLISALTYTTTHLNDPDRKSVV